MQFWKSLALGLAVLLGISYVGFAYVYSQGGGIMIAGMITGGQQPKVVTLLRDSNITDLQNWNTSVDIQGYKTGFLYFHGIAYKPHVLEQWELAMVYRFEVDNILGRNQTLARHPTWRSEHWRIDLEGTRMWISFYVTPWAPPSPWAVISMSLYLRD